MKVMITGVNGFLGSAIAQWLRSRYTDITLHGLARRPITNASFPIEICNLQDQGQLEIILNQCRPDIIFHFAGGRYPSDEDTFNANVQTTKVLLAALTQTNLKTSRVILPGSAAEYGNLLTSPITENELPKPLTWYGLVKYMQTELGLYASRNGQNLVVARMFNILGTGTPTSLALGTFAKQIVAIERGAPAIIKTKNLNGQRDFLDIDDVCEGLMALAKHGNSGEIYNLCSQHAVTIRDLLEQMIHLSTVANIQIEENTLDQSASFNVIGSSQKIVQLKSWHPSVSMQQSLLNTLNSYRNKG